MRAPFLLYSCRFYLLVWSSRNSNWLVGDSQLLRSTSPSDQLRRLQRPSRISATWSKSDLATEFVGAMQERRKATHKMDLFLSKAHHLSETWVLYKSLQRKNRVTKLSPQVFHPGVFLKNKISLILSWKYINKKLYSNHYILVQDNV